LQAARANIGHLLASVSPRIEKAAYLMNPSLIAPTLQGLMRRKRPIKSGECGYYVYMDTDINMLSMLTFALHPSFF
jgi:hypothetical protein